MQSDYCSMTDYKAKLSRMPLTFSQIGLDILTWLLDSHPAQKFFALNT